MCFASRHSNKRGCRFQTPNWPSVYHSAFSHCITGNVERVILYNTAFPTAKKRHFKLLLAMRMFNLGSTSSLWQSEMPFYGNLELFLFIKLVVCDCR